jgi:hypothetical protein
VKKNTKKNSNWPAIIIAMVGYIALNVIGLIYHEKWLDEAQIWLIARDLNPWQIVQQMHYELSPSLWHQILHLFAANNFPYITQSILNSVVMIAAALVVLRYLNLKMITKIMFIFSYYFAFEYALISKSYSLTILFLIIVAAIYKEREKYRWWYAILAVLMANTNTIGMISATALGVIFLWELIEKNNKKIVDWLPFLLIIGGILAAIWQIYPVADVNHSNNFFRFKHYLTAINGFAMSFMPWKMLLINNLLLMRENIWSISWPNIVIFIIIFSLIIIRFIKQPKILCFLLINYFGLAYLLIFRDNGHLRHYGFFIIWLIVSMAFESANLKKKIQRNIKINKIFNIVLITSLVFLNVCCIKAYYFEVKYSFSPTKKAAEFITENNWEDAYWVTDSFYMTSLLAYFPEKKIWQANCHEEISFFQVNKQCIQGLPKTLENIKTITKKKLFENKQIIFFSNKQLSKPYTDNWKLIYTNDGYVFGYDYHDLFIYEYFQ